MKIEKYKFPHSSFLSVEKDTEIIVSQFLKNNNLKKNIFYILKIYIKKYFYNIDHNILKRILKDNIKDKKAINLLFKVIYSTNDTYINEQIIILK